MVVRVKMMMIVTMMVVVAAMVMVVIVVTLCQSQWGEDINQSKSIMVILFLPMIGLSSMM